MIDHAAPDEGCDPAQVHHAEAVLSARLGISVQDAVGVLRTIAHCAGTPLIDVARRVLAPESMD